MDCEVLFPKIGRRGTAIMQAMINAASGEGIRCHVTTQYQGDSPWLMSYGLGHVSRRVWTDHHVRNGGRLIGWDMGYWDRGSMMRLTIDHDHPHRLITDMPPTRLSGIKLREDSDPTGPVILVRMGAKTHKQFGQAAVNWEVNAAQRIREIYPDRVLIDRPKLQNIVKIRTGQCPIEDLLRGASLVVCRHSNVAIDACIAGVPVVCEDGAGFALYGNDIKRPVNPTPHQRSRFLHNLAWWQWHPGEAAEAWQFIKGKLCESM